MRAEAWREDIGSFANVMLDELMERDDSVYAINAFDSEDSPLVPEGEWCVKIKSRATGRFSDPIFIPRDIVLHMEKGDLADLIYRVYTSWLQERNSKEWRFDSRLALAQLYAGHEESILKTDVPERALNPGGMKDA